jgi:hypothetical protein
MKRDLPSAFTRFLLNIYTNHFVRVFWKGLCSGTFSVLNGVKQGWIVSPILFCIYVDGLLCRLRDSTVVCFIGDMFVGTLTHADDIIIIIIAKRFNVP